MKKEKKLKPPKKRTKRAVKEKRCARYRSTCSKATRMRIERACSQKLFLVSAEYVGPHCREYAIMGSTGNIYNVTISTLPNCTCPDFQKGNLCKHILFTYLKVLKLAPFSPHIYQRGLLKAEIGDIFAKAPERVLNGVRANASVRESYRKLTGREDKSGPHSEESKGIVRKKIEGDCPICMEDLGKAKKNDVTFCKVQCGQNVHKECIQKYIASLRGRRKAAHCPYCRARWERNKGSRASSRNLSGVRANEGYLNLGQVQGMRVTREYYPQDWRERW